MMLSEMVQMHHEAIPVLVQIENASSAILLRPCPMGQSEDFGAGSNFVLLGERGRAWTHVVLARNYNGSGMVQKV